MNKKFKKTIILLILSLVIATGVYAWFTSNKTVTIDSMDAQVTTAGGVEISVDGINWKATVTSSELLAHENYRTAINQIPGTIYPVSSAGSITNAKLDMFYGMIEPNDEGTFMLTATKETDKDGTEGRYIAFDVFLRATRATVMSLNPDTVITSTSKSGSTPSGIENAIRIAIIDKGTVADGVDVATIQSLNKTESLTIIEPNYDSHTATGVNQASNIYGITGLTVGNNNREVPYYGIKNNIEQKIELDSKDSRYLQQVNNIIYIPKSFFSGNNHKEIFYLKQGITKLRIYAWIEGQDVDCESGASGSDIQLSLQFIATGNSKQN